MEKVEIIDPCSDPRWDRFVENHPLGWIVHTSNWKKVIESAFPHMKGHYFALVDSQTKTIKAGLPIYEIRSWLTGNRLVSIPFATISDPLVSTDKQCETLLNATKDLLKEIGYSYIEIRTFKTHELINDETFLYNDDYKHHYLDLSIGLDALWKNLSYKSIRYLINKASKNNLTLKPANNEQDLKSFHALYSATRRRLGLPAQPYVFFKKLYESFGPAGNVCILLAQFENRDIAGHFIFKFNGRFSVEASGDDPSYRHLHGNHFLYWEGIKSACTDKFRIFDFGRTSVYNPTLMDFKKRWGTQQANLCTFFYNRYNNEIRATNRETGLSYRLIRFICHKTPGAIQPALSKFCYRHLG